MTTQWLIQSLMNIHTTALLTILLWFLITYIIEFKSWAQQRRFPGSQCLSITQASSPTTLSSAFSLSPPKHAWYPATWQLMVSISVAHDHCPPLPINPRSCIAMLDTSLWLTSDTWWKIVCGKFKMNDPEKSVRGNWDSHGLIWTVTMVPKHIKPCFV